MKKLIEGTELLSRVPDCSAAKSFPVIPMAKGMILDDSCFPLLLMGNMGTGKSFQLKLIMDYVMRYCLPRGDNAVIFCAKPELLVYARPGDVVVDVFSTDIASCWSIYCEMAASEHPEMTAREIAAAIFGDTEKRTSQPFFPQAARHIMLNSLLFLYSHAVETGTPFSNADICDFLEHTPIWGSDERPGWMELAEAHPDYFGMVRQYIGEEGGEQGKGVLSELHTHLSDTLRGSFATENGVFSAIKSLKRGGQRIFLYYDYAKAGHSTLTVLKLMLDLLLKQAMDIEAQHKTWFFLDEASLLPKSDSLMDCLSLGRDPGSNGTGGVRIVMALQSARLMERHYTPTEAQLLLSLFPNLICLRVQDSSSRKLFAERFGKAHYLFACAGVGDRIHQFDSFEDVVNDTHFAKLRRQGQAIVSLPTLCAAPFFYDGYQKER